MSLPLFQTDAEGVAELPLGGDWQDAVWFTIDGRAEQRGSKVAIVLYDKRTGQPRLDKRGKVILHAKDSNERSEPYMKRVHALATREMAGAPLLDCPIALAAKFYFERPKYHFGTGRNAGALKASAPECHAQSPDLAKLLRCLEDALTGAIWTDDKLVCAYPDTGRYWGSPARTEVSIRVRPADLLAWTGGSQT